MLVPSWKLNAPKIVAYEAWDHERTYRDAVGRGEVTPEESLEILEQRIVDTLTELTEATGRTRGPAGAAYGSAGRADRRDHE